MADNLDSLVKDGFARVDQVMEWYRKELDTYIPQMPDEAAKRQFNEARFRMKEDKWRAISEAEVRRYKQDYQAEAKRIRFKLIDQLPGASELFITHIYDEPGGLEGLGEIARDFRALTEQYKAKVGNKP